MLSLREGKLLCSCHHSSLGLRQRKSVQHALYGREAGTHVWWSVSFSRLIFPRRSLMRALLSDPHCTNVYLYQIYTYHEVVGFHDSTHFQAYPQLSKTEGTSGANLGRAFRVATICIKCREMHAKSSCSTCRTAFGPESTAAAAPDNFQSFRWWGSVRLSTSGS